MAVSVVEVLITGDATSLKLAFTQATAATEQYAAATKASSAATKQASATASAFGTATARAFTYAKLGALAFAAVSVKSALDFNRQFTQIEAITNTASTSIGGLKDTVLALSQETAVAPVELAHSMYYLASAGLTTQQQMEALDASAKATAIGLGDSADLARITANALNAFNDQGLRASEVMDTLVAAVREGTAEPDEFASALGRVLPIADQAGISFQAVAASLSTMSNAGLDVNEGVTALRAILQSLVAPTEQTETALTSMGLSVDEVVRSMQSQGLIATLRLVSDAAKKATSTQGEYNQLMRHSIPNIRGLAGALNLLHQDSSRVDQIFQQVKNSTGDMASAFETTQQSGAFRISQALNEIAIAGMNLATAVLPPIATALEAIVPPIVAILPYAVQFGGVWLALKIAPPILAAVSTGVLALGDAFVAASVNAQLATASFRPWMLLVGLIAIAASTASRNWEVVIPVIAAVTIEIGYLSGALEAAQAKLGAFALAAIMIQKAYSAVKDLQGGIGDAASGFAHQMETQNDSLANTNARVEATLGERQKFLDSFFSDAPNFQGYAAWDKAVEQLKADIAAQNAEITKGTPLMATYGGVLNNTSTTSLKLHGALAQVLTDYYKQNDGLRGLNTVQLNTLVTQGKWHAAINLVSDALAKSTAEINKQAQAQSALHQSMIAKDFARIAPFVDSIGMSFEQFQKAAADAFNGSKEESDKFLADMTTKWTDAWNQFKESAYTALDFTSQALADLGSAASSAMDQLSGSTADMSKDALADLGDQATITSGEIISAFKASAEQTRQFGRDLLDISKVGGAAGKALASSLLESGNIAAASTIANSSQQKQITALYGTNMELADKLSTKLTDAIVGPLDQIVNLLTRLAKHWGLTVTPHTDKAKGELDKIREGAKEATRQRILRLELKDNASGGIRVLQSETDHLVGTGPHNVVFALNTERAKSQLAAFDTSLDNFIQKSREIRIGVHTEPDSPWPDEALQQRFVDPIKAMGFKQVGDAWTVPLEVGTHTDATAPSINSTTATEIPPMPEIPDETKKTQGLLGPLREIRHDTGKLLQVQRSSHGFLKDIKGLLKSGSGGDGTKSGGSGGGGDGTKTGRDGSGTGSAAGEGPIPKAVDAIADLSYKSGQTIGEAAGLIRKISQEGRNPNLIASAVKGMKAELGPDAAKEFAQALKMLDLKTNASDAKRDAAIEEVKNLLKRTGGGGAGGDDATKRQITGPLTGMLKDFKLYIASVQSPKYAKEWMKEITKQINMKGTSDKEELLIKQAMRDMAKVTNAKEAHKATDEFRRAIAHWEESLKKHQNPLGVRRSEREWADLALKNVPNLPAGHTRISTNPHNRPVHVRIDRKHMDEQGAYQTNYSGFAS